MPLQSYN